MTVSVKPKLAQLKTPMTSTFPSELSALSARTPLSGFPDFVKQEDGINTPITPPTAYTDFLKSMASPLDRDKSPTSAPTSATSEPLCDTHKLPSSTSAPPSAAYPTSAPSSARSTRPRILPSPVFSAGDTPLSATSSVRSPFQARSPYDWDPNGKGRYFDVKSPKTSRAPVRHFREIVTRTVTYTPRMSPAPKGKRRKLD